ncbi:MAG TPA: DNA gyrase subunit A [Candidatus Latescibacteria bacterium]|nr:DNA gyrase subunit A [Candidatus Latescibacterota bacterium]
MPQQKRVIPVYIEDEMKRSYLDYSMSVIVSRALPDVRDGLKPSQRRILVAMNDLGLGPDRHHRKCAKIAGDTSGNYHPHGEAVVYPTLVRLAQDFNMRYPLVDGQGNFGSIDGDPPAAMRYTEARMSPLAVEMLQDLEKGTVDFVPNYDGTREEPTVLPGRFPNLVCNGSSGIAVGMATSIPPHNLCEVVDGLIALIDDPDIDIDGLMEYIKGPDFPTGAVIYGSEGVREAYHTGRGKVVVRARVEIEEKNGREDIIITELPFLVNKASLLERIADLVRERKIDGISDLRDESDREGIRVVIELKKDANSSLVLNTLYNHTPLQSTFGIIMLALVDGGPKTLTLKELLSLYLDHRHSVVIRRTRFDLERAKKRAHLLEGLRIAIANIDEVVSIIRGAQSQAVAKEALLERFSLSEVQAQAILEMRLGRLTQLEREKVEEEHRTTLELISDLEGILASQPRRMQIIKDELLRLKNKYGDPRRTEITMAIAGFTPEDLIPVEDVVVTISHAGYIKRLPVGSYRRQHRGGRGIVGMGTKEEDFVEHLFTASTHDYVIFFTDKGRCYWLKVYEVPESGRTARGRSLVNLLRIGQDEHIAAFVSVKEFTERQYLILATRKGLVKKTPLSAYSNPRKGGIRAISIREDDRVIEAALTDGDCEVILATKKGRAIRFHEGELRDTGRTAQGVRGIRLSEGDEVVGMVVVRDERETLLTVCEKGYGKRTRIEDYPKRHRGGRGVISVKLTERNGDVVGVEKVDNRDEVMIISQQGNVIRLRSKGIKTISRITRGVKLINLNPGDRVTDVARTITDS